MQLGASISAGTRSVTLLPLTAGTLINLGGPDAVGTLGLDNSELAQITAGTLQIVVRHLRNA